MSFDPYLHFRGECRAAMEFYRAVFGGELQVMTYAEMPDAPPEMKGSSLVMHAALLSGGRVLMASDYPPGMAGDAQMAVSISHTAASVEAARRVFDRLAEGGATLMDFGPTFWSDGFGMAKDRFGTHWIVSAPARPG